MDAPLSRITLSPRERHVLLRLSDGAGPQGIAIELRIKPWTVVAHIAKARRKRDKPNRVAAEAFAVRRGLIA